jgi:hypothetical protein
VDKWIVGYFFEDLRPSFVDIQALKEKFKIDKLKNIEMTDREVLEFVLKKSGVFNEDFSLPHVDEKKWIKRVLNLGETNVACSKKTPSGYFGYPHNHSQVSNARSLCVFVWVQKSAPFFSDDGML